MTAEHTPVEVPQQEIAPDAIVILGKNIGVDWGPEQVAEQRHHLSPHARINVLGGILEYKRLVALGHSPKIVFSSGETVNGFNEAHLQKAHAKRIAPSIPDEAFILEDQSMDTAGNAKKVGEIVSTHGMNKIELATVGFHVPRSEMLFRRRGMKVTSVATEDVLARKFPRFVENYKASDLYKKEAKKEKTAKLVQSVPILGEVASRLVNWKRSRNEAKAVKKNPDSLDSTTAEFDPDSLEMIIEEDQIQIPVEKLIAEQAKSSDIKVFDAIYTATVLPEDDSHIIFIKKIDPDGKITVLTQRIMGEDDSVGHVERSSYRLEDSAVGEVNLSSDTVLPGNARLIRAGIKGYSRGGEENDSAAVDLAEIFESLMPQAFEIDREGRVLNVPDIQPSGVEPIYSYYLGKKIYPGHTAPEVPTTADTEFEAEKAWSQALEEENERLTQGLAKAQREKLHGMMSAMLARKVLESTRASDEEEKPVSVDLNSEMKAVIKGLQAFSDEQVKIHEVAQKYSEKDAVKSDKWQMDFIALNSEIENRVPVPGPIIDAKTEKTSLKARLKRFTSEVTDLASIIANPESLQVSLGKKADLSKKGKKGIVYRKELRGILGLKGRERVVSKKVSDSYTSKSAVEVNPDLKGSADVYDARTSAVKVVGAPVNERVYKSLLRSQGRDGARRATARAKDVIHSAVGPEITVSNDEKARETDMKAAVPVDLSVNGRKNGGSKNNSPADLAVI